MAGDIRSLWVWWSAVVMLVLSMVVVIPVPTTQARVGGYTRRAEPPPNQQDMYIKKINMPGVTPKVADAYLCTAVALNGSREEWVVRFDPLASANRAHHMLLFGCSGVSQDNLRNGYWDCGHHGVCEGGRIMYAWAKNAPATVLPDQVGFKIGGGSGIQYLTLQIHYAHPLEDGIKDESGLQMKVTTHKQKYKAGIYLLASGGAVIPPNTPKTHADMNCVLGMTGEPVDINIFAFRVHAHVLGTVITGYHFDSQTKDWTQVAKGNPHWPQAFYPTSEIMRVRPTDILHARCTWNSTGRDRTTYIGSTSADEMCNLYLMYYTDRELGSESGGCGAQSFPDLTKALPWGSDTPLPPNPLLEEHAHGENKHEEKAVTYNIDDNDITLEKKAQSRKDPQPSESSRFGSRLGGGGVGGIGGGGLGGGQEYDNNNNYPKPKQLSLSHHLPQDTQTPALTQLPRTSKKLKGSAFHVVRGWGEGGDVKFGQVTAVAVDSGGDVVVFHRGERSWDGSTFKNNNRLRQVSSPISQPTILHMDKTSGRILHKWGRDMFYMPHGLTLDQHDNIWVTDVGMHQVIKFPAGYGQGHPALTLGTKFEPGSDNTHFCKPTAVAVLTSGEFFVSDGYCNARILKYDATGKLLFQFGKHSEGSVLGLRISSPAPSTFNVPHALTVAAGEAEVCVADRENGRVQCFTTDQGKFTRQFQFQGWGRRLFSVAYTHTKGGRLFAVNGPAMFGSQKVMAFEVDYSTGELVGTFSPANQGLSNPHDLAVSSEGTEVYVAEIGPNKLWKFQLDEDRRRSPPPQLGLLQRITYFITSFIA